MTSSNPKISVIIPTYNCEKYINETILSVTNQTYSNWELIIVDDFSKDRTRQIVRDWEKKDTRIKKIFLDNNSGGPAHPKNVGVKIAQGEFIAFLDHDDIWLNNKLEKQIAVLIQNKNIGLISCEAHTINDKMEIIDYVKIKKIENNNVFPEILTNDFISSNSSLIIPKKVILEVGERDTDKKIGIAEDREYEMRIAVSNYKLFVIHEPLFLYRIHKNNTSKIGNRQGLNYAFANNKYFSYYKKYKMEYLIYERFAKEYLKIGDYQNSKKYCEETLKIHSNVQLKFFYNLLRIGKIGSIISKKILNFRTVLLYSKK